MDVLNLGFVPGKKISQVCGLVQGCCVQSKHIGRDIAAGIKGIFGGELRGYTELLEESRATAMSRMIEQARKMRANAIINVRFTTSAITPGACELFCYGTAVITQNE